jgi:hypothetical protein
VAEWRPDSDAIRSAVIALCDWTASDADRMLVVLDNDEGVTALVRSILPETSMRVVASLDDALIRTLSCAVLIGGMDEEINLAKAIRKAGKKVWPMATTGAAARRFLYEIVQSFQRSERSALLALCNYAYLYKTILPS